MSRWLLAAAAAVLLAGVIVVSSALAGGKTNPFKVSSTLAGKRVLPLRIHWIASPHLRRSKVAEVEFLIDGRLGWVEHHAPYVYGDDGNWLVTSFLTPGRHVFTVRVVAVGGQTATSTTSSTVVAPPTPPSALAHTWQRTATTEDLHKCTTAVEGGCPPTGTWRVTIAAVGWKMRDPQGGGGNFDVAYRSGGRLQMRPTIEHAPYPNTNNGGWCADTDPLSTWITLVGDGGTTLNLHPVGHDPCGSRAAILEGTWTRVK